jgi:hypothetical protein
MTYQIKPTDGSTPYTVNAETVEVEASSGASIFKDGSGNIVAKIYNASFHQLPDPE